ncbi:MAG: sensor histidine kinase [Spirochaetaceae bacterium]|jgi:two-component system sensor histidine kinase YesM|nr:sensor histidine kinase [Spirochaetaceae bacterium]
MAKTGQNKGDRASFSLRWALVTLILIGWILPVFVILIVSGFLSTRSTKERVSDIVTATIENAASNVQRDLDIAIYSALNISYVPTIRLAYMQYENDGNLPELTNICREFLSQQYSRSQVISAAYLLFPEVPDGEMLRCFTYNPTSLVAPEALEFYTNGSSEQASAMMDTLDTNVGFFRTDERFYLIRNLSLRDNRFNPYALLITEINLESVVQRLGGIPWLTDISLYVNDIPLAILGTELKNLGGFNGTRDIHLSSFDDDRLMVSAFIPLERYDFSYSMEADLREMIREMGNPLLIILLITLISLPLLALVLLFFIRYISSPISRLSRLAGQIEGGELGAQTEIRRLGSAEFVYLGSQMNAMSARLQYQFECLYREELALRDARIMALQSQINPHFLGNTLEIINWEARLSGCDKVSQMMESLSTILRATQDRNSRPLIPLSEELTYIDAYLFIIQKRFGKRLEVQREIDEQLLDWNVPRLILQPIVENAVEHGVSNRHHGIITIRAVKLDDEWMRLDVENNSPMSESDEQKVHRLLYIEVLGGRNSGNIGIRNVHQRLRILYGERSGLVVRNGGNGNTISSMHIHNRAEEHAGGSV